MIIILDAILTVKREIEHLPMHDPFQFKRNISLVVVKFIISSLTHRCFPLVRYQMFIERKSLQNTWK